MAMVAIAMMLHMKVSLTSIQQAKEERFHGKKIYDYINDRGEHAEFKSIPLLKLNLNLSLKHLKMD